MAEPIHDREQAIKTVLAITFFDPVPGIKDALGGRYRKEAERIVDALGIGTTDPKAMPEPISDEEILLLGRLVDAESRAERAEERLRAATDVFRYLADTENWLGNPLDQQATLHGHFTPYELARTVLSNEGAESSGTQD